MERNRALQIRLTQLEEQRLDAALATFKPPLSRAYFCVQAVLEKLDKLDLLASPIDLRPGAAPAEAYIERANTGDQPVVDRPGPAAIPSPAAPVRSVALQEAPIGHGGPIVKPKTENRKPKTARGVAK